jgi:hypothetical protein
MDLREIGIDGVNWIPLAQDRVQCISNNIVSRIYAEVYSGLYLKLMRTQTSLLYKI